MEWTKYIMGMLTGLVAILEPTLVYIPILLVAILFDVITAVDLNRRLKRQYPDRVSGKFESQYALRIVRTFGQAFGVIILAHWVDEVILEHTGSLYLSNYVAAFFVGIQLWSMLENLSSANGALWAKVLQKIMVDKSSRHLGTDIKQYIDEARKEQQQEEDKPNGE